MRKYNFIMEQTSIASIGQGSIKVIQEAKTPSGELKAIFRCLLQRAEERNQNKRYYTKAICKSIVEQLAPKASARALLMEADQHGPV